LSSAATGTRVIRRIHPDRKPRAVIAARYRNAEVSRKAILAMIPENQLIRGKVEDALATILLSFAISNSAGKTKW